MNRINEGGGTMRHITLNTARENFDGLFDAVIELGESVSIAADKGAAVLVSQEEWSGLLETLYLQSIPGLTESVKEARETPANERLENVGWDIN